MCVYGKTCIKGPASTLTTYNPTFNRLHGTCRHRANTCQRSYAPWWKLGLITMVYLLKLVVVLSSCFPTLFRTLESVIQSRVSFRRWQWGKTKKNSVLKHVSFHLISPPPLWVLLREGERRRERERECVCVCSTGFLILHVM